eukprot:m.135482 g.135482  ORF g.135482 m.135482 type:complete len:576 (+) comp14712_c0_seq1:328-2055(+)
MSGRPQKILTEPPQRGGKAAAGQQRASKTQTLPTRKSKHGLEGKHRHSVHGRATLSSLTQSRPGQTGSTRLASMHEPVKERTHSHVRSVSESELDTPSKPGSYPNHTSSRDEGNRNRSKTLNSIPSGSYKSNSFVFVDYSLQTNDEELSGNTLSKISRTPLWYKPGLHPNHVTTLLGNTPDGTFLMRVSTTDPGARTLCVSHQGIVLQFRIIRVRLTSKNTESLHRHAYHVIGKDSFLFRNLTDLVKYSQKHPLFNCLLTGPPQLRHQKMALMNGSHDKPKTTAKYEHVVLFRKKEGVVDSAKMFKYKTMDQRELAHLLDNDIIQDNEIILSNIEVFIDCTKKGTRDFNAVCGNVRQFLNGLKNLIIGQYFTKIEKFLRGPEEESRALDVLENSLQLQVLPALKNFIMDLASEGLKAKFGTDLMEERMEKMIKIKSEDLGAPDFVNKVDWSKPHLKLKEMEKADCAMLKVNYFLEAIREMHTAVDDVDRQVAGADDLMPLCVYMVARSGLKEPETEVAYMQALIDPTLVTGEQSYYLTTFEGAISIIRQWKHDQPTGAQPSSELLSFAKDLLDGL